MLLNLAPSTPVGIGVQLNLPRGQKAIFVLAENAYLSGIQHRNSDVWMHLKYKDRVCMSDEIRLLEEFYFFLYLPDGLLAILPRPKALIALTLKAYPVYGISPWTTNERWSVRFPSFTASVATVISGISG